MKKEAPLDGKTPNWFKQWHEAQFKPLRSTVKSNSRWIYIIVAAIIAASLASNGNLEAIGKLVRVFAGA